MVILCLFFFSCSLEWECWPLWETWDNTVKAAGNSDLIQEGKFSNTVFSFFSSNCGFLCGIQFTFIKMFTTGEQKIQSDKIFYCSCWLHVRSAIKLWGANQYIFSITMKKVVFATNFHLRDPSEMEQIYIRVNLDPFTPSPLFNSFEIWNY